MPITRLGGGFYMFGTKKIYCKIMNGRLVVRVGGGYMDIQEFINTYADSEILKMKRFSIEEIEALHNPNQMGLNSSQGMNSRSSTAGQMKSPRSSSSGIKN